MSEICSILRTALAIVRNLSHISDMETVAPDTDIRSRVLARIESKPDEVWTPGDFADLGGRAAVDKTLQRLAAAQELRRIDRGLPGCCKAGTGGPAAGLRRRRAALVLRGAPATGRRRRQLTEHRSSSGAIVQVVSGRLRFRASGEDHDLGPSSWLYMAPGEEHALEAIEPSLMLLTLIRD